VLAEVHFARERHRAELFEASHGLDPLAIERDTLDRPRDRLAETGLLERAALGDAIAQHGLSSRPTEFAGLGPDETRRAVQSGWRLLKLAGVEPQGFVAPGYAYTPALRATLRDRYAWWADLLRLHGPLRSEPFAPAFRLSPLALRASALMSGPLLRIDLRPSDLERTRHMLALERVLRRARRRTAVTYDDLAAAT
jgi:hypothetical protein